MVLVRNISFDMTSINGKIIHPMEKIVINSISQVINSGISQGSVEYITF